MSREVTNSQGLIGSVIIVLLIVLVLIKSHRFARTYDVAVYTLVLMEQPDIQSKYFRDYGIDLPGLNGYCDQSNRILYVAYAKKGVPNFEYLGHEQWHLPELGGRFHK